ncbi:hypothetical protein PGT21_034547 [Puccinia graminis f. sp. tritici]|uniref:Uncharacterized protein n=2 Tax=Puccinia graminis f. sp. tritici TaxID=56615 RepID=E3KMZ5_PUCGT|nr:uncharacterized protein PGTG_10960 [Puccinia graminis f. sp. tritici CRL 75-36-700-3]EFP85631.2 hypothetical protein PGTG_10960 [Puccinia graminis f. sp. tritici CRL 75-36-700-3]KAA1098387.1 hypothetical protein PGT21_034547 [Puccinia graminis f. sp. tritici]KAA1125660.1 hypothetical protein PGTUg99_018615 [Puccinia graminis f. sp. tritici]
MINLESSSLAGIDIEDSRTAPPPGERHSASLMQHSSGPSLSDEPSKNNRNFAAGLPKQPNLSPSCTQSHRIRCGRKSGQTIPNHQQREVSLGFRAYLREIFR